MDPASIAARAAGGDTGNLILIVLLVTAGYIVACVLWPFTACRVCEGQGKFRSPSGRAWRKCRRCKGTGTRIRRGRRLWTSLRRTHERGTRDK